MIKFFLILLLLLPCQVFAMSGMPSANVTLGKPAPEFTLETALGKNQSLTQARQGKRAMVIFWATWCPHCREELETLRQKIDEINQKGIQIILVNAGESKEEVKAYFKREGITLDSFLDEDNTVSGLYGVVGIPTLIFIDEKGILQTVLHDLPGDYETKFISK